MQIIAIPFVVFAFCCAAQFYFVHRVYSALNTRHPDVWRDISRKSWLSLDATNKFALKRQDKGLNDPDLTRRTKQLFWLNCVAVGSWALIVVLLVSKVGFHRI